MLEIWLQPCPTRDEGDGGGGSRGFPRGAGATVAASTREPNLPVRIKKKNQGLAAYLVAVTCPELDTEGSETLLPESVLCLSQKKSQKKPCLMMYI